MYLGQVLEVGPAEAVFSGPHHPYTSALLSSVPSISEERQDRVKLVGALPTTALRPTGCVFHTRCPQRIPGLCDTAAPPQIRLEAEHVINCHLSPDALPVNG